MATRFYLPSSGTSPLPSLAVHTSWDYPDERVPGRMPTATTKAQNSALGDFIHSFPSTATQDMCFAQWVSEPIEAYDFLVTDTWKFVVRNVEDSLSVDANTAIAVRVVSGDGSTVRGVLLSTATGGEFAVAAATCAGGSTCAAVSALTGDRIVIELGAHGVTPSTAYTATMRFGDPAATADFGWTGGLTTDLCPWVELSPTLTFVSVSDSVTGSGGVHAGASLAGSGSNIDTYVSHIENLLPGTHYYLRAYLTNPSATGYGDEFEFITTPEPVAGTGTVAASAILSGAGSYAPPPTGPPERAMSFLWTNSYLSEISGDLATIKASHIDVIYACLMGQVVCPGRPIPASDAEMTAYLDALDAAGLKAMLDVQGFGKYVVSSRDSKVLTSGELDALTAYINKWKNHPAVWGWYADDEGGLEYPIAARQQVYDTIKDHYPAGQVFETHNWLVPGAYSPAVHDVYALDVYAYFYDTDPRGCISEATGLVTDSTKETAALDSFEATLNNRRADLDAAGETGYIVCMQAFGHGFDGNWSVFAMPPADGGISRMWAKVQAANCAASGVGWFLWKSNDAATMPGGVGEQLVGVGDNDHGFNYSAQRAEISAIAAVVAGYEPPADVLTVKTHTMTISGAGTSGATVTGGGRVTSDGGNTVTARGVCWNTTGAPTTADPKTVESGTTGGYASVLIDLLPDTMYHVRAYATSSAGTSYGAEIDFSYLGPLKPTPSLPAYSILIGVPGSEPSEDITELVDLDTLHRSMSERGEASATIDIPVASENEVPVNGLARDATVEIVVDGGREWLGHVVAVHKPQPQDLAYVLDCAGGWDTLHHCAPYCKGFVEARYEELVQVSAAAAAHLGLLPSAAATMDTDGQLLLMIPKGGDVKTRQGIAAGYWLFGGMDPDSHISRVTFDWVTGGDTASMYCVAGLQEGLYDYSSAFSFFFENLQPPGSGSADFDVDVEFNYTYEPRAIVFMVQDEYDVTATTADTFLQIRNLRVYIDRTTAPRVDEIVAAIDAEVRPGAPAASTEAIGAPLTAFMLDPWTTPADGIATALAKAAVPPLCGIIQNQLHIGNRPTAPPDATRLWTVSEQLTPGLEWGVEVDEEQSVDYVSVSYAVIGDATIPDGTPQIAYYPSAPPNVAARTGLIDGGDLTATEAAFYAEQGYHYLHDLASGPVTIPYVVQDANGNERPADVIRAWDWVQNVGSLDPATAGPFLVSEVEHQGHIATLVVGASEAYAYNGPERMPTKGRYVGAHRVRTRTKKRVSFAEYWKWKHRKDKKKPKMPRHHARYGTIRGFKWTDVEGKYV